MTDKDFQQDIRASLCDIGSGIDETNELLEKILEGKKQQTIPLFTGACAICGSTVRPQRYTEEEFICEACYRVRCYNEGLSNNSLRELAARAAMYAGRLTCAKS